MMRLAGTGAQPRRAELGDWPGRKKGLRRLSGEP